MLFWPGVLRKKMRDGQAGKSELCLIRNQLKAAIGVRHGDGSGCSVFIKSFAPGQSWQSMLGYVNKDEGKPHYRRVTHNVTNAEIAAGKTSWAVCRLSYEEDRLILTKKNLMSALYTSRCVPQRNSHCDHVTRHQVICTDPYPPTAIPRYAYDPNVPRVRMRSADAAPGTVGPFIDEMTSFLNSYRAIPAPNMIMSFGGQMRSVAAEALWKLANKTPISIDECAAMLFTDWQPMPSATAQPHQRYWSSHVPSADASAGAGVGAGVGVGAAAGIGSSPAAGSPAMRPPRRAVVNDDDDDDGAGVGIPAAAETLSGAHIDADTAAPADDSVDTAVAGEATADAGVRRSSRVRTGTAYERVRRVLQRRTAPSLTRAVGDDLPEYMAIDPAADAELLLDVQANTAEGLPLRAGEPWQGETRVMRAARANAGARTSHFIADEVAVDGDEDDDEDGDEDGEEDDDDNGSMAGFIDDRGEDELSVSGDEVDA